MAKLRTDSWAAKLTPEQQAALYQKARQGSAWEAMQLAATEFNLDKTPSQSSFYRWLRAIREDEHRQRLEDTAIAASEAAALGEKMPGDEKIIAALKARILEDTLTGKTKEAADLIRIADILHGHLMKEKALALAERRLRVLEQTKIGEMKKLREEKAAAQEEARKNKKQPLVWHFPNGGLPPIRKSQDTTENVADKEKQATAAAANQDSPTA